MKKIRICKAESLHEEIESQTITIEDKIPEDLGPRDNAEIFYGNQAQKIDDALCGSLPQATYDRLGIMFIKRKLSICQGKTET